MKKMKVFQLNIANLMLRFYLMMALVLIFGMFRQFEVAAILGFAVAISAILGVGQEQEPHKIQSRQSGRLVPLKGEEGVRKAG